MSGHEVITLPILYGFILPILGAIGGGFAAGKYLTQLKMERSFQRAEEDLRRELEVDWGVVELRTRIRIINEIRTDVRERITGRTPPEVEDAYNALIQDLDNQIRWLQRAFDGTSENRQQRGGSSR